MIHIGLLDDHAVVRSGIRFLTQTTSDIQICLSTDNKDELWQYLQAKKPIDVLILDIHLPDANGFDLIQTIKGQYPLLKILVFSMDSEFNSAKRALRMGANAYLNKQNATSEILEAIREIYIHSRYMSISQRPWLEKALQEEQGSNYESLHINLSNREFQLFIALAEGKTNKEIAMAFNLSVNTVSNHRSNIMKKMDFSSNADIVKYALQHDLI